MKNLFTFRIPPEGEERYVPYENPYLVSRVSPETEALMQDGEEDDTPKLNEEEKAAIRAKEKKYLICILLCFALSLGAFMLISRIHLPGNGIFGFIPLIGMAVALIFVYKMKQLQWKRTGMMTADEIKSVDFQAMAKRIEEAATAARAEMHIPEEAESVEILPYAYKEKGGRQVPDKKDGHFDNTPLTMFSQNGSLCIFDGVGLYEIPLADIKGYRVYDQDYRIDFWLKEGEPTDEAYAAYQFRKCGILEYKTHTYYGVEVICGVTGETFEMLVPGYDFAELSKVIDIEAIA